MKIPELKAFSLAGGTALALQIGHRISVDLDFFGQSDLPLSEVNDLISSLGDCQILNQNKAILTTSIDRIKVDFVKYPYKEIGTITNVDGIRLYSIPDIAAMKIAAIIGRGTMRDFYDIFFLMEKFKLKELLGFYHKKFPDGSSFLALKSLVYFDDAEENEPPKLFKNLPWEEVKSRIQKSVRKI